MPPKCSTKQGIVIENLSFENVEKFKYLGVMLTNTNDIHEEMKHNKHGKCMLLFTWRNFIIPPAFQVNAYKTIILPYVLYGCESWISPWERSIG